MPFGADCRSWSLSCWEVLPAISSGAFAEHQNGSGYQYFHSRVKPEHAGLTAAGGGEHGGSAAVGAGRQTDDDLHVPMLANYVFSAMAGLTWYMQFFFYTMGETQWGNTSSPVGPCTWRASSFSARCGEWPCTNGGEAAKKTHALITAGIAVLILSTVIVGYGNKLQPTESGTAAVEEPEPA